MKNIICAVILLFFLEPGKSLNAQVVATMAIIETTADPDCQCDHWRDKFHTNVWKSDTYASQIYWAKWGAFENGFAELDDIVGDQSISYFAKNRFKKANRQIEISTTIYNADGLPIHTYKSPISKFSDLDAYALQVDREMRFYKNKGRLMETILIEDFEAEEPFRQLNYHSEIPRWVYKQLNKPYMKEVAKVKRVTKCDDNVKSYVNGEISKNPMDPNYIKVDFDIYIRDTNLTSQDVENSFIMDGGNHKIGNSESKDYWTKLIQAIHKELVK
ncbi:hypothetical protein [Ekhidna sp. To15]|uniref:hypothetical protein n=1 Tax=Ekhidna sp. To15 TaxID=3395267 RepID=UPI003F51F4F7